MYLLNPGITSRFARCRNQRRYALNDPIFAENRGQMMSPVASMIVEHTRISTLFIEIVSLYEIQGDESEEAERTQMMLFVI